MNAHVRSLAHPDAPHSTRDPRAHGQVVLVLQGGGALGAYQAGVYQAMHEAGLEPDWVIGTSIGAINAAIIAGNAPDKRIVRLREFWRRVDRGLASDMVAQWPYLGPLAANWMTMMQGLGGFFRPNPFAFASAHAPLGAERAAYYSTAELRETLSALIDFERLDERAPRLTVGAANVRTSEMRYFDSARERLGLEHVLASGALPPAFPAVKIGEDHYWDGGILSNTPVEAVFDDAPRKNSLIFAVHIWNPRGDAPDTIWQVMHRQKDLQYSSRAANHIKRQQQIHELRRAVAQLGRAIPPAQRTPEIEALLDHGCLVRMHVVRLLAPRVPGEDHAKDIDFSAAGIRARWDAGYADTTRVLKAAPWEAEVDPELGFLLHEASGGVMTPPEELAVHA